MEPITAYKCGEIFRNSLGTFLFSCHFCTAVFISRKAILVHIEKHFAIKCDDDPQADNVDDVESDGIYSADGKEFNETNDDNSSSDDFFWPMIPDTYDVNNDDGDDDDDDDDDFSWPMDFTEDFPPESSIDFVWPPVPTHKQAIPEKLKSVTEPQRVRRKRRQISCHVCGKTLRTDSFSNHMTRHFGEPKYTCDICGKIYKVKKSLRSHMTTHLTHQPKRQRQKKTYMCHHCGLTSTSNQALAIHMSTHTGEKKFKCEECDLAWSTPDSYNAHMRLHKAYDKNSGIPFDKHFSCKICNGKYLNWHSFVQHERTHTGDRSNECEICQQSFCSSQSYRQHRILHTNEKPYRCRYCGKNFAQRTTCYGHEKFVHRKMPRKKAKQLKDPIQSNNPIALPSASTASMANYSEQPSTLPSTQNEPEIVYKSEEVLTIFDVHNMNNLE